MSMIEDIKRDREAGTPGPFHIGEDISIDEAWSIVTTKDGVIVANVNDCKGRKSNARRIARLPDLEAKYIALKEAADELAEAALELQAALSEAKEGQDVNYGESALARYREASQ